MPDAGLIPVDLSARLEVRTAPGAHVREEALYFSLDVGGVWAFLGRHPLERHEAPRLRRSGPGTIRPKTGRRNGDPAAQPPARMQQAISHARACVRESQERRKPIVRLRSLAARVARRRPMRHPARVNRGILTSLALGLVLGGCSGGPVVLGWNVDAGSAAATSCQTNGAGLTDCGADRESCCASLEVTGGKFYRTYENSGSGPTGEADPATVSSFRLDKYLVTVGRFRQFVTAWEGGWVPPVGSGKHTHLNGGKGLSATGGGYESGWVKSDSGNVAPSDANLACLGPLVPDLAAGSTYGTWTHLVGTQEHLPISCVNWYEAYAFCIWDGGFLPSDAEGEYAAAGGNAEREYPWGATDPGTGNRYAIYGCDYPSGGGACTGVANIAPVGTPAHGAGLWGQLDLAGDLWEWNLDGYADYVDPCVDCANLTADSQRVARGGDFNTGASRLSSALRHPNNPSDPGAYAYGIRCARSSP